MSDSIDRESNSEKIKRISTALESLNIAHEELEKTVQTFDLSGILKKFELLIKNGQLTTENNILKESLLLSEERFLTLQKEHIEALRALKEFETNFANSFDGKLATIIEIVTTNKLHLQQICTAHLEQMKEFVNDTFAKLEDPVKNSIQEVVKTFDTENKTLLMTIDEIQTSGKKVFIDVIQNFTDGKKEFDKTLELTQESGIKMFEKLFKKRNLIDILVLLLAIFTFIGLCVGLLILSQ